MSQPLLAIPVRRDIDEQMSETHVALLEPDAAHALLNWLERIEELAPEGVVELRANASDLLRYQDLFPVELDSWAEELLEGDRSAAIVETETDPPAAPITRTEGLWVEVQASGFLRLEVWIDDGLGGGYPMYSEYLDQGDLAVFTRGK